MIDFKHDISYAELGQTITQAHQVLSEQKEKNHGVNELEKIFKSFLLHPVGRNWEFNRKLKKWIGDNHG
jgi:hypothetical protein